MSTSASIQPVSMTDVVAAARLFADTVDELTDEQLRAPSLLPGWSRAHVIAHVALNAEGFVTVADTPSDRRPAVMYPGGTVERDREIATLASVAPSALRQRSREADVRFAERWDPMPSPRECATADGHPVFSSASVVQRRARELQVHLVDLGVDGVGADAWLPGFVDADLVLQWPTVAHRTSERVAVDDEHGVRWETEPSPPATRERRVSRRRLLGWVLDRVQIDGLPDLEPWTNRSKWEWTSADS